MGKGWRNSDNLISSHQQLWNSVRMLHSVHSSSPRPCRCVSSVG